jgi:hypothetical protein
VEVCLRLVQRATKAISHTHHPLTLFDLKQSIGLVYDLKQETEGAQDLAGWFDIRELTILEEAKEAKAGAKEKAKAATKQKAKEKRREKDPKTGPYRKIDKVKEKNVSAPVKKPATKKTAKLNLV